LLFLKDYYVKQGFINFTLDASHSTKEEGLDQKARIAIFHKAGFEINTETGYFTASGDYKIIKTIVVLDTNDIVEIQKKNSKFYLVKNNRGKTYAVTINQIEKCLDEESNQISCPMIMNIGSSGGKRKTHKRNSKSKTDFPV
jgi:hypothetical protein